MANTTETPSTKKRGSPKSRGRAKPPPAAAPETGPEDTDTDDAPASSGKLDGFEPEPGPAAQGQVASFTCDPQELARVIGRVRGATTHKTTMPILSSVLIRSEKGSGEGDEGEDGGRVIVTATDLELSLTAACSATVRREGAIAVPAKVLADIVRALPKEPMHFQADRKNGIELRCGKVRYRIQGLDATNYPATGREEVDLAAIDAGAFRELIDRTAYAICRDESRYNLCGLLLEQSPDLDDVQPGVRAVATDGSRLAIADARWATAPTIRKGVVVPRKGVVEMRKLLDTGADATAQFGLGESSVVMERAGERLTCQLVSGQFPNYSQVLPGDPTLTIRVDRLAFRAALARVETIAVGKGLMGVRFDPKGSTLRVAANVIDVGEFEEELEIELQGRPASLGLSVAFVAEAVDALGDEDRIELRVVDALSPVRLVGAEDGGAEATGIVMPMRI